MNYREPLYLQIREIVRGRIESGEYAPGTAIPSENELAELYGVNRLTVRSAIDALVAEGRLRRLQGRGVFVAGAPVSRDLERLNGFSQTMSEKKLRPSFKLRSREIFRAGEKYAAVFGISPQDPIVCVRRISLADAQPVSLDEIRFPYSLLPNADQIDYAVFSMSELYGYYGVDLYRADQTLDLVYVGAQEARLLNVAVDAPVMRFCDVSYDRTGRIIDVARSYARSDNCEYLVHFRR